MKMPVEPIILDNRGLEPPNPMIRTLEKLEMLNDDEILIIINDRPPMFLYPELEERGYTHDTEPHPDGGFQITIKKGS
jgi:tRNA 2-thiouridine synthesizing protein A